MGSDYLSEGLNDDHVDDVQTSILTNNHVSSLATLQSEGNEISEQPTENSYNNCSIKELKEKVEHELLFARTDLKRMTLQRKRTRKRLRDQIAKNDNFKNILFEDLDTALLIQCRRKRKLCHKTELLKECKLLKQAVDLVNDVSNIDSLKVVICIEKMKELHVNYNNQVHEISKAMVRLRAKRVSVEKNLTNHKVSYSRMFRATGSKNVKAIKVVARQIASDIFECPDVNYTSHTLLSLEDEVFNMVKQILQHVMQWQQRTGYRFGSAITSHGGYHSASLGLNRSGLPSADAYTKTSLADRLSSLIDWRGTIQHRPPNISLPDLKNILLKRHGTLFNLKELQAFFKSIYGFPLRQMLSTKYTRTMTHDGSLLGRRRSTNVPNLSICMGGGHAPILTSKISIIK